MQRLSLAAQTDKVDRKCEFQGRGGVKMHKVFHLPQKMPGSPDERRAESVLAMQTALRHAVRAHVGGTSHDNYKSAFQQAEAFTAITSGRPFKATRSTNERPPPGLESQTSNAICCDEATGYHAHHTFWSILEDSEIG